jgi:hypothetical protein
MAANNSCNYLDVAPDNVATLDYAFRMRSEAEKYLYTCYSYMTKEGDNRADPAIFGGDEIWTLDNSFSLESLNLARGFQNINTPLFGDHWSRMYQGIRVCNTFLENVDKVPDIPAWEKEEWKGEALFLKAWYHFYLVRMYGPIPLVKENLPISANPDQVKVSRNTVDECFDYIIELLDEAIDKLPPRIVNPVRNMGRTTKPIAAGVKAKVMVTAASPLYNGNTDQATLKNGDGTQLFNTNVDAGKWTKAVQACREAIEICHAENYKLYKFQSNATLSDTIMQQMTIRNGFCEKWNSGIIWVNQQTVGAFWDNQRRATANLDIRYLDHAALESTSQPPLKIAEMYYTNHGVPITEDKEWKNLDVLALRKGTHAERYYIKKDYTTIQLHFDREPRFYASLGFDGGIWYGQGREDNNPDGYFYIACRMGGAQQKKGQYWGPVTGYFWKKCVHVQNVQSGIGSYDVEYYPWPLLRLADLYLLYAEAINEAEGVDGANSSEMFKYIDLVRESAGLKGVKYSWDNYAETKKYTSKEGMKQIIHRERLIELSLEGQRFWDLRRWKEVYDAYTTPIEGFKIMESAPEQFYRRVVLWNQTFNLKDYFWPLAIADIEQNPNLVQNIGW